MTGDETWGFHHTPESKQGGKRFDDDDDVQEEVMTWFKGLAADFYDSGIQKLVPRLNKCLDNACDYVETIHSQCRFCKLKMLYMFKTFVSLLSGHASYINHGGTAVQLNKNCCYYG